MAESMKLTALWLVVPCATTEKTAIFSVLKVLTAYCISRIVGPQLNNKEAEAFFKMA